MSPVEPHLAQLIHQLKATYFANLDTKQWDRMGMLFTEDAEFSGYAFNAAGANGFIRAVASFLDGVKSQHAGYNPRLSTQEDGSVRGVWAMHDYLTWEPGTRGYRGFESADLYGIRGWGYYEDTYTNTGSGIWKIAYSRLVRSRIDPLVGNPPVTVDKIESTVDPEWLFE